MSASRTASLSQASDKLPQPTIAAALACAAVLACAGPLRRDSPALSAAELRAAIDHHTCAMWSDEAGQWSVEFLSEQCPAPPAGTTLAEVSARAATRARPLVLLADEGYDFFYESVAAVPRDQPETATRLARDAFWRDPLLGRAIWGSVHHELRAESLSCPDCPNGPAPEQTALSWHEFLPYLRAYVWPLRVESEIAIFVCSGNNGADQLPGPPALARAGFLVAAGLAEDPALSATIQRLAEQHREDPELSAIHRAIDALLDSPQARIRACEALARVAWFTGIAVADCRG